jgi:chemotaxis protein histidine kinase CheA
MRDFFREKGEEPVKHKVVVVEHARRKVGLIVDELVGEFQTVIKPLGKIFNRLQWISGSTILGTGEVAYILDIPRLIQGIRHITFEMAAIMKSGSSRKILLVEDEALISMTETLFLKSKGYTVIPASTGDKALKYIQEQDDIDLVLWI